MAAGVYFYRQSASEEPVATAAEGGGDQGGGRGRGMFGSSGGRPAQIVTVDLARAEVGSIEEKLPLTGSLKPVEQVDVTPKSTGRVVKIYFNVGDSVKSGDVIAELDRDELEQQISRAQAAITVSRASLAQRQAELANAEAQFARVEQLHDGGLISPQDYESQRTQTEVVRAQVTLAEAQLQQSEAELRQLNIQLDQTSILAPIDGQVANRNADVGALLGPNSPIVRLVNLSTMMTQANVPEREVARLRVGSRAVVHVDAFGDREFVGHVARIAPVLDAATRSALIDIAIDNPGGLLRAEMFARVELDLASTREALLIPREALVYRGQQPGVYLVNGNQPEFQPLDIGLNQGSMVEVLSNLEPGTVIVGKGSTMIGEGDTIRVASEPSES